jgi:Plasmid pRiA4b ORF-3-like protein
MARRRSPHVFVFRAKLLGVKGVRRRIAVRGDQTLADLHVALQDSFAWADDHLYAFWLDGVHWSRGGVEFTDPHHARELDDPQTRTARVRLGDLALEPGQKIAYVFDFGDEWRVELTVARVDADDGGVYPRLLESTGEAPPQYPALEEDVA